MNQYADILAFDRHGQLALIVEVKNKRGTTREWAAKMRRNMYAHGLLPHAPYFLLALPDKFYLWKNTGKTPDALEPTEEFDSQPYLQPYYRQLNISSDNLTGEIFEFIVTSWLNQVLRARTPQDLPDSFQNGLISSGLFDKLAGGRLELEVAA